MTDRPACPRCAEPTAPDDRFCEACGADLHARRGGTTAAVRAHPPGACPHCGDRPVPGDPEPDGWCPSCGARRPDGSDRVETALAAGAAVSDRGHVRPRNEDAFALGHAGGVAAAVVCDGVSSVDSAELAARAAAEAALDHLLQAGGEDGVRAAVAAAARAAAGVASPAHRHPPSCTLVCGVVGPGAVTVGWVGDSRAYWLADAGAALLTADHVAATAPPGTVDPAVAAARPDAITRWLGADSTAEPDVVALAPDGPGALLLCTDGLWKYLPAAADVAALALPALHAGGPRAAVDALVAAALAAGGEDNVTVAVIPVPHTRRSSP